METIYNKKGFFVSIIYPIFALVLLTFAVCFGVGLARLISVQKRQVSPKYYKLLSGYTPPDYVVKLGRNFDNLLEVPVLFYLLGVLMIALNLSSAFILNLAWAFVVFRLIHTLIHITYNTPTHRFLAYLVSCTILLVMWIEFIMIIGQQG